MITLQLEAKRIKMLIPILRKEIEKNPDGYINIEIKSIDYPIPAVNWTLEIDC